MSASIRTAPAVPPLPTPAPAPVPTLPGRGFAHAGGGVRPRSSACSWATYSASPSSRLDTVPRSVRDVVAMVDEKGELPHETKAGGNDKKLKYRINSISPFIVALSTDFLAPGFAVSVIINFGPSLFTYIHNDWIGLVTAALIDSVVQAFVWYVWSFRPGHLLALDGNTGNQFYDVSTSIFLSRQRSSIVLISKDESSAQFCIQLLVDKINGLTSRPDSSETRSDELRRLRLTLLSTVPSSSLPSPLLRQLLSAIDRVI